MRSVDCAERATKALEGTIRGAGGGGYSLSEDREDSPKPVEEDAPTLLKRVLFGVLVGTFVTFLEFAAGLPGLSSAGSLWNGVLGILAAGSAFGTNNAPSNSGRLLDRLDVAA